jgi:hypothetical protein
VTEKKSTTSSVKEKRTATSNKPAAKKHAGHPLEAAVTIDRRESRDRRSTADRRIHNAPVATERRVLERRVKVSRRRQIDPTTCERDYSGEEVEFMNAMDDYKRRSGRMFPTCSEVLEVIKSLGYERRTGSEPVSAPQGVDLFADATPAVPVGG